MEQITEASGRRRSCTRQDKERAFGTDHRWRKTSINSNLRSLRRAAYSQHISSCTVQDVFYYKLFCALYCRSLRPLACDRMSHARALVLSSACILQSSPRGRAIRLGVDYNISPRDTISRAEKKGKTSAEDLDRLRRSAILSQLYKSFTDSEPEKKLWSALQCYRTSASLHRCGREFPLLPLTRTERF